MRDQPKHEDVRKANHQPQSQPKLAVRLEEAAEMLSMSLDSFSRYVRPSIKTIRVGSMVLVPVSELERWAEGHAICIGTGWR